MIGLGPGGDRLGRVDDAPAAHGENHVDLPGPGKLDALPCLGQKGVGFDAGKLHDVDACLLEGIQDLLVDPGRPDAAHPVNHEHAAAEALDLGADLGDGSFPEDDPCGVFKHEVLHGVPPGKWSVWSI